MTYFFKAALTECGWQENVHITVDNNGIITEIGPATNGNNAEFINGYALPGFQNAHSHAFLSTLPFGMTIFLSLEGINPIGAS